MCQDFYFGGSRSERDASLIIQASRASSHFYVRPDPGSSPKTAFNTD